MMRVQRVLLCKRVSKANQKVLQLPTSNWTKDAANAISTTVHKPMLGLPQGTMNLTQKALTMLKIDKRRLFGQDPAVHVKIPSVMASLGIKDILPEAVRAMSNAEIDAYLKLRDERNDMTNNLNRFMTKLQIAANATKVLKDEQAAKHGISVNSNREKLIDTFAWTLATICGFDTKPLVLTATGFDDPKKRGHEFKMFGESVAGPADLFVARNAFVGCGAHKLVIVFEDKCESVKKSGHIAQILGECIMMQYNNIIRHDVADSVVYCIRVINHFVQFFALRCSKPQLVSICNGKDDGVIVSKLALACHDSNPETSMGLDLIDRNDRLTAMNLASSIRGCAQRLTV